MPREVVLEGAGVDLTILVAKDARGKAVFAHVVLQKGVDPEHYAVDALMEDIKWLGYTALALRSDNEPAIFEVAEARDHRVADPCGAAGKDPRGASSSLQPRWER